MRFRPLLALVLALCLTLVTACSGGAEAKDRANLTYDDIHNTGLANDCPTLPESARGSIALTAGGKYQLRELCLHPAEVYVKGEPANKRQEAQFVAGKILTRFTTSLDQVYGDLNVQGDKLGFKELGGLDFQLVTVLLPGGEEVPFVFSSKELDASADGAAITTSTDFNGSYRVPSYRTSNFLDPKARGLTTGYSSAVGLVPAGDDYTSETVKKYVDGTGNMSLSITKVDGNTGEFAGVFTAVQPSDTDMGTKQPVDVKITGELYGRLEQA
ncbi:MAG: Photosystem II manganese-stabilizing polypeptide [Cyanobacteria bacterium K_DeepCast_35m_m2_155]|nr:Photosystem II manganese-stabilizing polypeptide [Cyanobacteria bacterium K_DeepCast_35m_m2_155]